MNGMQYFANKQHLIWHHMLYRSTTKAILVYCDHLPKEAVHQYNQSLKECKDKQQQNLCISSFVSYLIKTTTCSYHILQRVERSRIESKVHQL